MTNRAGVLLLVVCGACPPPPSMTVDAGGSTMDAGSGPRELAGCAAWATAECEWRARCFGATSATCQTALQQRCATSAASVEASMLGYDAMKAASCATQAATRACDAALACSPFTVTTTLNDACLTGFDCGEGQECGGLTCPSACHYATEGSPCGAFECTSGTCDRSSGFCRSKSVPGRGCRTAGDCSSGLACLSSGAAGLTCQPLPMRGQPCSTDQNDPRTCRDEDFCDSNAGFTCKARLELGVACSPRQCVAGASCENGTCTKTTTGSTCELDLECPLGLACQANRCQSPPDMHGAACSPVNPCRYPALTCGQVSSQCIDLTRPLGDQELCGPGAGRCRSGLVCEEVALNDWRCRKHAGRMAGVSCSADAQCESLTCAGNQCAAPVGGGQSCTDAPCLAGFACLNGTCVGAGMLGTRCLPGERCTEGVCVSGSCSPPKADGASCSVSGECASGKCRDGKCLAACTAR